MSDNLIDRFAEKSILVIGDVMLDRYLDGSVDRVSPEAPVPVLNHKNTQERPGGAANVALNLSGLQAKVFVASVIGKDPHGETLKSLLQETGINTDAVVSTQTRMTTAKTRIMAQSQHLLRVDQEVTHPVDRETSDRLLASIERIFTGEVIDMVILQDYNKGVLSAENIASILSLCTEHKVLVAVDPKFENFTHYKGVNILKPNLAELRAALPFSIEVNEEDLARASDYLREKMACEIVLVTLSDKGIYVNDSNEAHLLPTIKRSIVDVCGAGDTVISVAALAHLSGANRVEMARLASMAGTIACQYPGVIPITSSLLSDEWAK